MNRWFHVIALAVLCTAGAAFAAPFAQWFDAVSPNGTAIRVYGEGDEFDAWFETEDGHAVWWPDGSAGYVYMRKLEDGSLASTGILVGEESGREAELAAIPLHERDTSDAHAREVLERKETFDRENHITEKWEDLKAVTAARAKAEELAAQGIYMAPPSSPTVGTFKGAVILVNFPSETNPNATLWDEQNSEVTAEKVDRMFNGGPGVTEFGNYCSVRQYYLDVSDGKFDYSNEIIGPVLLPYPRSHYDDTSKSSSVCAHNMFADLANANFSSEDRAKLSRAGSRGVNVVFAGREGSRWSYGLWGHMSSTPVTFGGKKFQNYQISPLGTRPSIYVFCHENGHMMCDFPDFYSYGGLGHNMVGTACLMSSRANDYCPSTVSAYLRVHAGWATPKNLRNYDNSVVTITRTVTDIYKYQNPDNPDEYYLIENRGGGHDGWMCGGGKGILIWHCDDDGGNRYSSSYNPVFANDGNAQYRIANCELTLEQADGNYHMERRQNSGDASDLWHAGNTSAGYHDEFNDVSCPTARWKNGDYSNLVLSQFSAEGTTMTFVMGDPSLAGGPRGTFEISKEGPSSASLSITVSELGDNASSVEVIAEFTTDRNGREAIASLPLGTRTGTGTFTADIPYPSLTSDNYVRIRFKNNQGRSSCTSAQKLVPQETLDSALDAVGLGAWHSSDLYHWEIVNTNPKHGNSCLKFRSNKSSEKAAFRFTVKTPCTITVWAKLERGGLGTGNFYVMRVPASGSPTFVTDFNNSCNSYDGEWHEVTLNIEASTSGGGGNGNGHGGGGGGGTTPKEETFEIYLQQMSGQVWVTGYLDWFQCSTVSTTEVDNDFAATIVTPTLAQTNATVAIDVVNDGGEATLNKTMVISKNTDYSEAIYNGPANGNVNVYDLQPLTRYYVKGTLVGSKTHYAVGSFKTLDWTPPSGRIEVSDLTFESARIAATVTNLGSEVTMPGVQLQVAGDLGFVDDLYSGPSPVTISNLAPNTTYYVRATLTGTLTDPVVIDGSFTTPDYSNPTVTIANGGKSVDYAEAIVTITDPGTGSTGSTVLVEAIGPDNVVASSVTGTASGTYTLTGLARKTVYTLRVTVTASTGKIGTASTTVETDDGPEFRLGAPVATVATNGLSATLAVDVLGLNVQGTLKLYITNELLQTWSFPPNDLGNYAKTISVPRGSTNEFRFVANGTLNGEPVTTTAEGYFVATTWTGWFDVKLGSSVYAAGSGWANAADPTGSWTASPSTHTVLNAGAEPFVEFDDDLDEEVRFTPTNPSETGADVEVKGRVRASSGSGIDIPATAIGALKFVEGEGDSILPAVYDGAEWHAFGSGGFMEYEWVDYKAEFNYATAGSPRLRLTVGSFVSPWYDIAPAARKVTAVAYEGGAFADFKGWYWSLLPDGGTIVIPPPPAPEIATVGVGTATMAQSGANVPVFSVSLSNLKAGYWYTVVTSESLTGPFVPETPAVTDGLTVQNASVFIQSDCATLAIPIQASQSSKFAKIVVSTDPLPANWTSTGK